MIECLKPILKTVVRSMPNKVYTFNVHSVAQQQDSSVLDASGVQSLVLTGILPSVSVCRINR